MPVSTVVTRESIRNTPPLATYVDNIVLAGVAKTVTVPPNAARVIFGTTATPFYLRVGGTAAAPGADVTDGTGSAINPSDRLVTGGSTFSLFAAAAIVSLEWHVYSLVNG
jgi:hypothetical protein